MPLVYVDVIEGRSPAQVTALLDAVHAAVVAAFGVPSRDRYQVLRSHPGHEVVVLDSGLGITRSPSPVVIHLVSKKRPRDLKERFYETLAATLSQQCGIDPADLVVAMSENGDQDWSFGYGRAQFLTGELS